MAQISEKNLIYIKGMSVFSLQIFSEIFLVLVKIKRDITVKVRKPSREVPGIIVRF